MNKYIVDAMNTVSISAPTSCWACRAANESRVVQLEIQFIVTFIGYARAAAAAAPLPQQGCCNNIIESRRKFCSERESIQLVVDYILMYLRGREARRQWCTLYN